MSAFLGRRGVDGASWTGERAQWPPCLKRVQFLTLACSVGSLRLTSGSHRLMRQHFGVLMYVMLLSRLAFPAGWPVCSLPLGSPKGSASPRRLPRGCSPSSGRQFCLCVSRGLVVLEAVLWDGLPGPRLSFPTTSSLGVLQSPWHSGSSSPCCVAFMAVFGGQPRSPMFGFLGDTWLWLTVASLARSWSSGVVWGVGEGIPGRAMRTGMREELRRACRRPVQVRGDGTGVPMLRGRGCPRGIRPRPVRLAAVLAPEATVTMT